MRLELEMRTLLRGGAGFDWQEDQSIKVGRGFIGAGIAS